MGSSSQNKVDERDRPMDTSSETTPITSKRTVPSKVKKKKNHPVFIAIHLGAGDHSSKKSEAYKSLCKNACNQAKLILTKGGTAGEAVAAATVIIEDSGIVNAGRGSSLTIQKTVEGDAGFMNGRGFFGGVGAVPGVANPILVAKKIADVRESEPVLSCGRVPPELLCGDGAHLWAQSNMIPTCENRDLLSKRTVKIYDKYMDKLAEADMTICDEVSDTVGAIALDKYGNVASSVSSGGNWLKHSGRMGHAPLFGCGCWASDGNIDETVPAFAISSSGSGEMLSKVHLPQQIGRIVRGEPNASLVQTVSSVIQKEFLDNDVLKTHKEAKNVGLIALLWEGRRGEFVWGHTAQNFVVAYTGSSFRSVKMDFSTLNPGTKAGKSLKVDAVLF